MSLRSFVPEKISWLLIKCSRPSSGIEQPWNCRKVKFTFMFSAHQNERKIRKILPSLTSHIDSFYSNPPNIFGTINFQKMGAFF